MGFLAALIQTVIKMAIVAAVAFGGIVLGKTLNNKKAQKDAE